MKRSDGREYDQLRKISIKRNFIKHAEGSCLIEFGDTMVVCTATVDKNVPQFLRNTGKGWITSEYSMMPRATQIRRSRDKISGRDMEIQRLIGRSLRSIIDLKKLGERTIWIDCDVIQADGGTRIASTVGGFAALVDSVYGLYQQGMIGEMCIIDYLGAVSVGLIGGNPALDLCFKEDSQADVDMNVVMRGTGEFTEIQGTGERSTFSGSELDSLLALAKKGINEIIAMEKEWLKERLFNV